MLSKVVEALGSLGVSGEITAETTLAELGLDSIMVLELVVALEEKLDCTFDDTDLVGPNFYSVGTVMSLVEKYGANI